MKKLAVILLIIVDFAQAQSIEQTVGSTIDLNATTNVSHPLSNSIKNQQTLLHFKYKGEKILYPSLPVMLFLPENYIPQKSYPTILYLHGATGQGSFKDSNFINEAPDFFINHFLKEGFIVIKPFADQKEKFCWNPNPFRRSTNYTFPVLEMIVQSIKRIVNINDNQVFALGHSDGADGAFCMALYSPTLFAGIYCYNTMAKQLFTNPVYIDNLKNSKIYMVHSDKDDLRPMEMHEIILGKLKEHGIKMHYKLYKGFKHFDTHLESDLQIATRAMEQQKRNPYPDTVNWETDDRRYTGKFAWLSITRARQDSTEAEWHIYDSVPVDVDKIRYQYYPGFKGSKVMATHSANDFVITTDNVDSLEILISPKMVNLAKPINVTVNGERVAYDLKASSKFANEYLSATHDKTVTWVNKIKIRVPLRISKPI